MNIIKHAYVPADVSSSFERLPRNMPERCYAYAYKIYEFNASQQRLF